VTCGDVVCVATIIDLLDRDLAEVVLGAERRLISVGLVDARPGQRVLVHAGEAIGYAP
jgi:hydrogenase expression/formation protein HypC